jgi:hypothetical protein
VASKQPTNPNGETQKRQSQIRDPLSPLIIDGSHPLALAHKAKPNASRVGHHATAVPAAKMPHEIEEKIEELEKKIGVTFGMSTPRASISSRRFSVTNPEVEKLRQRRLELRHDPAVAEDAKLRKQIEKIEKEIHTAQREEKKREEAKLHAPGGGGRNQLHRIKSNDGVMFLARPKIRAYFHHDELFRSRGDHEYAATSSVSLFTDLLFVGVLAVSGALIDESGISLLEFMVAFLPAWRMWCYVRDIVSIYEMNAVSQRFLILWILSILIGFTLKY